MSLIIRMNTSYISYMFFLHGMPWTHHIVQLIIDIYLCSHIKWLWIKSLYLEERILDVNKSYQKSIGFFTFKRILFFFFTYFTLLYFIFITVINFYYKWVRNQFEKYRNCALCTLSLQLHTHTHKIIMQLFFSLRKP